MVGFYNPLHDINDGGDEELDQNGANDGNVGLVSLPHDLIVKWSISVKFKNVY